MFDDGGHVHGILGGDVGLMLNDVDDSEALLVDRAPVAMDPNLAARRLMYGQLMQERWKADILELADAGFIRERAGAFCVRKKDGKQRVIFDARNSNMHFRVPPRTELASGASLSAMQVKEGEPIFIGQGDAECCFYQYALAP